jgi:MoxR-like ATPase
MPLLIEGEPGTGKTELPLQYAASQKTEMFVYPAGSKSNVEQFVAKFDHVKYLRDSQIEILNAQRNEKGLETKLSTGGRDTESLSDYVVLGPAAKAFSQPNSVLLIDEIDKAPREFPNDLLYALSHRKFILPESGKVIETTEKDMPAIVITSNREQELPTAFKGRCIYHYIQFPDSEKMRLIVSKHHAEVSNEIELLNWLRYIKTFTTQEALSKINALDGLGTLIKTQADLEKVKRQFGNPSESSFGTLN